MNPNKPDADKAAEENKTDFQIAWELSQTKDKPFSVDIFKRLLTLYDNEEISLSKVVEELNVAAYKWQSSQSGKERAALERLYKWRLCYDIRPEGEDEFDADIEFAHQVLYGKQEDDKQTKNTEP